MLKRGQYGHWNFQPEPSCQSLLRLEEAPKVISLGPCLELDLP